MDVDEHGSVLSIVAADGDGWEAVYVDTRGDPWREPVVAWAVYVGDDDAGHVGPIVRSHSCDPWQDLVLAGSSGGANDDASHHAFVGVFRSDEDWQSAPGVDARIRAVIRADIEAKEAEVEST